MRIEHGWVAGIFAIVLTGCGGDDGDTNVLAGKDKKARGDIATLRAEVALLQSQVAALQSSASALELQGDATESLADELNADLQTLEATVTALQASSPIRLFDSNDLSIGRVMGYLSSQASVMTSKGYLLRTDFPSGQLRRDIGAEGVYFQSQNCTGQGYIFLGYYPDNRWEWVNGSVHANLNPAGGVSYIPASPDATTQELLSTWSGTTCTNGNYSLEVVPFYANDENVTGYPDAAQPPFTMAR